MQSRQSIQLRQHQQLALTPQLQQSIRFLQLSAHDLEEEVAQALLDNPLLEREEEYDIEVVRTEPASSEAELDGRSSMSVSSKVTGSDDDFARPEVGQVDTLHQHLIEQLKLTRATARDCALIRLLVDELNENGYLSTPLDEILNYLPVELDVDMSELQAALSLLQSFDPPGVAATSLSNCLLLQLRQVSLSVSPDVLACARELAGKHLELLASGNLAKLRSLLLCSQETLCAAHGLLLSLNPKPGRSWATSQADYITPEIIIRKVKNRWKAVINPAVMPKLRVNPLYERLIKEGKAAEVPVAESPADVSLDAAPEAVAPSLQSHIVQAHGVVKSVHQRFETILRVGQAVVEHQQAFFESGMQAMRPLILRDIAQELQMHESTVSRATRQKYAQTPWGVFELKYFFGTALNTDAGEATSATAIRSLIHKLIIEEPAKKPLSDNQIAVRLAEQGVVIARRTVAKYREAAGIKPASLRKAHAQLNGPA